MALNIAFARRHQLCCDFVYIGILNVTMKEANRSIYALLKMTFVCRTEVLAQASVKPPCRKGDESAALSALSMYPSGVQI